MTDAPPMHDDDWFRIDRPVLMALAARVRASQYGDELFNPGEIARQLELPEPDVERAFRRLNDARYTEIPRNPGRLVRVIGITGRGLREVGMWPNEESVVARLIEALDRAIETATPERKPFLVRAREGLATLPQDAAVAFGSALIGSGIMG